MAKKLKEPTHVGTSVMSNHDSYHEKKEHSRVFLRETKTQWREFNGKGVWKKDTSYRLDDRRWGWWGRIEDVHPVTTSDLKQYYEGLLGDAKSAFVTNENRQHRAESDVTAAENRLADLKIERRQISAEIDRLEAKVIEFTRLDDEQQG